jgi:hypothetical protein
MNRLDDKFHDKPGLAQAALVAVLAALTLAGWPLAARAAAKASVPGAERAALLQGAANATRSTW